MAPDLTSDNSSISRATHVPSRGPSPRPPDLDSPLTTPPRDSVDQPDPPSLHSGPASVHSAPLSSQAPGTKKTALPTLSWGGEILAGLVSAASLLALIVILAMQDGQPLSNWTFTLSLNTVASVLSMLFKKPLAYLVGSCVDQTKWIWFAKKHGLLSTFASIDEAGRGPMGCISLLWMLGFGWVNFTRLSLLFTIPQATRETDQGAFVTIALLIVDPFLQSVIEYPGKLASTDLHNATVGVATGLNVGDWWFSGQTYGDPETDKRIGACVIPYQDRGMSATAMLGFIDGSTSRLSQPPLLSCATGNCTWTYSTLAICSRCEDITSLITTETTESIFLVRPGENQDAVLDPVFIACAQETNSFRGKYLRYRLKENYNLSLCAPEGILEDYPSAGHGSFGHAGTDSPRVSGFGRTKKVRLAAGLVSSPQATYRFNASDTLLASIAVLHVSDDYWARKVPFNASSARATECSLNLCTQLYEAEMKLGELRERQLPSTSKREFDSFHEIHYQMSSHYNETWKDEDPGISLSRRGSFFENCGQDMAGSGLQLLVGRTDLQLHMSHDYDGDIDVQTTFNVTHKAIDTVIYDLETNLAPRLAEFLSSSDNITQTFERAAKLMSYHMREAAGGGSSATPGETSQWVTYIHVRWGYMLLPIVLAVVIAVFAVGATAQSYRLGLNDVKGDTVSAMLLIDGHTRDVLRVEPGGGRRDKIVRGLPLQLGRDEKGVYLEERASSFPLSNAGKP